MTVTKKEKRTTWRMPPPQITLKENDVHLWRVSLNKPEATRRKLWALLSFDERQKATRFRLTKDCQNYVVCRAALRTILGRYTQVRPQNLQFHYSIYGKPHLQNHPICFNVSHSGNWALYGITLEKQIGVDVEQMKPILDKEQLVSQLFSPREQQLFRTLAPRQRADAFFNGWTRKEAFIKAIGKGLSFPLDAFDVSLSPGVPARLLAVRGDDLERASHWSMNAIRIEANYKAAYVVEGEQCQPFHFTF